MGIHSDMALKNVPFVQLENVFILVKAAFSC